MKQFAPGSRLRPTIDKARQRAASLPPLVRDLIPLEDLALLTPEEFDQLTRLNLTPDQLRQNLLYARNQLREQQSIRVR